LLTKLAKFSMVLITNLISGSTEVSSSPKDVCKSTKMECDE